MPTLASSSRKHRELSLHIDYGYSNSRVELGVSRFRLPTLVRRYAAGVHDASAFGASCPQHDSVAVRSVVDDPSAGLLVTSLKAPWQRGSQPSEDCI